MENERNHILEDFRYGFCNLSGNSSNIIELESQLGWSEEAVSLLTEIYPIVGKMNLDLAVDRNSLIVIDEYDLSHDEIFKGYENSRWKIKYGKYFNDCRDDNKQGEVQPMKALSEISDYNDIIVELRKLLYSEIELSNYKVLDVEYERADQVVMDRLFKLGLQLTNFVDESLIEDELKDFQNFIVKSKLLGLPRSFHMQELVKFIDIQTREIMNSEPTYIRLEKIIECLEAIKNSGLVADADRLWNVFLLKLYTVALFDDGLGEFQEIDIRIDNDRYERSVRRNYIKIDQTLQMLQRSNIQNMLMLYSLNRVQSRAFYNGDVVRELYNALNSSEDLRGRYLHTINGNWRSSKNSTDKPPLSKKCFAAMYNRDTKKKYAAISGVFDADKYIYPGITTTKAKSKSLRRKKEYNNLVSLLKSILGKSYEVIDSDDDVKYYYKKSGKMKIVTAKRFISYPYPVDKRPGNRMFSCCERKLSTKLVVGCEHDFYVKYAPCTLCGRMIAEETKNNVHFINVFYAGEIGDITKKYLMEYDKAADAVK